MKTPLRCGFPINRRIRVAHYKGQRCKKVWLWKNACRRHSVYSKRVTEAILSAVNANPLITQAELKSIVDAIKENVT